MEDKNETVKLSAYERTKRWKLANPERVKEQKKRYYEKNKERIKKYHKDYNAKRNQI